MAWSASESRLLPRTSASTNAQGEHGCIGHMIHQLFQMHNAEMCVSQITLPETLRHAIKLSIFVLSVRKRLRGGVGAGVLSVLSSPYQ